MGETIVLAIKMIPATVQPAPTAILVLLIVLVPGSNKATLVMEHVALELDTQGYGMQSESGRHTYHQQHAVILACGTVSFLRQTVVRCIRRHICAHAMQHKLRVCIHLCTKPIANLCCCLASGKIHYHNNCRARWSRLPRGRWCLETHLALQ